MAEPLRRLVLPCVLASQVACVPSTPPCECMSQGPFPDTSLLDRSEPCQLDNVENCGYPAGPYGFSEGDVIANFVARTCDDTEIEFAEFLHERPDTGKLNRGVIIALGAGWCMPCRDEAELFIEVADDTRMKDVEIVQLLHQGFQAPQPPDTSTCEIWRDDVADNAFTILFDPEDSIDDLIKPPGDDSLPWLLVVDANGHIRFKEGGQAVEHDVLTAQIDSLFGDPYGS